MRSPVFTKEQIMWLQDKVINGITPSHYVLDCALSDKKVNRYIVKAAFKSLMRLVNDMRNLKYE